MKSILKATVCAALMAMGTLGASALTLEELDHIYLIGDATPGDWVNICSYELTKEGTKYTYEGGLVEGEFKFITQLGEWVPAVMPYEDNAMVGSNGWEGDIYVSVSGYPDQKWTVTKVGKYRIVIDTYEETLTCTYLGEMPKCIYAQGDATYRHAPEGLFMCQEPDGKYIWQGVLAYTDKNTLLKFALSREDSSVATFIAPASVDYNGNVKLLTEGLQQCQLTTAADAGGLKDWYWGVADGNDGVFRIVVDPVAVTIDVKRVSGLPGALDIDEVSTLYMNGLASGSFDSEKPGALLQSLGNGVFEWSGEMDYATVPEEKNNVNKQFKFLTDRGPWEKVWYIVPYEAKEDHHVEIVTPGNTYKMKATTWVGGRKGVDAFWGLPEGVKGKFTLHVDIRTMRLTITNYGEDGVEDVLAPDEEVLGIYTIDGRRVGNSDLSRGLYIYKTNHGVKKVLR